VFASTATCRRRHRLAVVVGRFERNAKVERIRMRVRIVRVFEMHKRHGLHVHMVTNERIDVVQARALAEKAGWSRIADGNYPAM